ncbi:MAG TPA: glycosyltransferase family 2 protein [Myxococcaceae bacterium]|nr:glycosyltransferase family 2 protein [Myxococcaceae bacterium]
MTSTEIAWLAVALIGLAYACASTWGTGLVVRGVPMLLGDTSRPPEDWPRVSLIVPARNEAETLGPAMQSRLTEGYPALEVVLVDDRSTDGTAAVVDAIAAEDPRVRTVHLTSLPAGWLGKLHAMREGLRLATGEWLLFSDADVHLAPGALRRAVSYAEALGLDHLSILPQLRPATWMVDAALASFTRTGLVMGRVWRVSDPRSTVGGSVGAFGLVRRSALERSPGIEHLRLEVADDLALGQMLKASGSRSAVVNGRGLVLIHWYRSLAELARGTEKATAVFDHRLWPALCWTGTLTALEIGPFVTALLAPSILTRGLGLLAATLLLGSTLWMCRFAGQRLLAALLSPLGVVVNGVLLLRASVLGKMRGGLLWRSTLYRPEDLRPGRRVRAPWSS